MRVIPERVLGGTWPSLWLLLCLLSGCVGPEPREPSPAAPAARQPALTVAWVFAPPRSDVNAELASLDRFSRSPAAELRRAYVLLQGGSPDRAAQIVREQLFGTPSPTVAVESFAWYLRSLIEQRKGDAAGARFAREKAVKLALDDELRNLAQAAEAASGGPRPRLASGAPVDGRFLKRNAWGSLPAHASEMERMGPVWRLTIHHSAMYLRDSSTAAAAAQISAIQREHMQKNGWGDIGYHYVIDTAGRVWEGRSLGWQGAHAGDHERNRGNVGICLLGNFIHSADGQEPSGPQVAALRGLVDSLRRQHSIRPEAVLTHRELRSTACPGERLQAVVERMRNEVAGVVAAGQ